MDGISVLNPSTPALQPLLYARGHAVGCLSRSDKTAAAPYNMAGRLYLAKSGWLLLSVPNAFVRGVFDALTAPGAELPTAGLMNVPNVAGDVLNAHISVMTAAEVEAIGADKINERGHMFYYALGPVEEIPVHNVDGVSKVWAVQVKSPALAALRKSYGLSPYIKDHQFHITVAARRKKVLANNDVSKFDTATGRGELKAAADDTTTYDCCCAGSCTCPPTCICKKSGYCGHKKQTADILPGGAADNKPDSAFPKKELQKGKKHEREHTNNEQVAAEIAKDHLQEEPDYYKKHAEEKEVNKEPAIIFQLRKAKEHSDAKRYKHKNEILRKLMHRAPEDWFVDDPDKYHMGITHAPTNFRFHADPKIIPVGVPVQKAANKNPYAGHLFDFRDPLPVKPNAGVWDMTLAHLKRVVDKGNWTAQAQQNTPRMLAAIDPAYKQQLNASIARGVWPQPDLLTQLIQRHGSGLLASLG
jgi:hypothetical protein